MSSTSVGARVAGTAAGRTPAAGAEHPIPHRWWVLAVIGLAQLMVVLDATIVNIALPSAQAALGFSNDGRQWVVTAYSLAFGSLLLLGGRLSDFFGRKTTLLIGLVGFAGASAVAGASTSLGMLIAGRAVQGAFGALLAPAALSLLTTTFTDPKERARAFGVFGAIAGSGGAIGLLLGGVLTEHLNWRYTLYVNLVIAVVAVIGAVVFVRRPAMPQRPKLDLLGTILAAGGVFGLVFGFSNAATHSWSNWLCWAFLAAGAVVLVVFALWEHRAAHPLLPLRVLADRNRAASYISVFVVGAGIFGIFLFLTYYLQETLHYSPVKTGLAFLPMIAMMVVFSQLSQLVLAPRLGGKPVVPVGSALAAGGLILLTRLGLTSTYPGHVLPALLLIGAGVGMVFPTAMSLATLGVAPRDQGVASAMVNTMQQVGGSIGTALFSTLAATAATNYIRDHQPTTRLTLAHAALHSYATAFWWAAGFFAAGLLIAVLLYRAGSPLRQMRAAQQAVVAEEAIAAHQLVPGLDSAADGSGATAMPSRGGPAAVPAAAGSASVSGRVVDMGGTIVPQAVVTLISPSGRQLGATTVAGDGRYAFAVPASGNCMLVGSAAGYQPQAAMINVGTGPLSYDLTLSRITGLHGTVLAGGTPVAGALVVATDPRGVVTGSILTGADGGYRLADLPPGDYALTVNAIGHQPAATTVAVGGGLPTVQDVTLNPAATLRGAVRGLDGRPLNDARVTLLDPAGDVVAEHTTGEDGTYAFTDLTGHKYTIIASGYAPLATPVQLGTDDRDDFDVYLSHSA
jgi:EmrB/QacA subfamily drug resistance transporter